MRRHILRAVLTMGGSGGGIGVDKDLTEVEMAFRTSKTVHLEMRPVHVRTEEHTRGHVLAVMLAFLIRRELSQACQGLNVTVEEGFGAVGHAVLDGGQGRRRRELPAHPDAAPWIGRLAQNRLGAGAGGATPLGDSCSRCRLGRIPQNAGAD